MLMAWVKGLNLQTGKHRHPEARWPLLQIRISVVKVKG